MKKRLLAIFAAVAVMATGVIGCGGSADYSKCITVGEYKGLEVTAIDTSVSDEELQKELDFMFHVDVRDGDYINLDFTGYVDGETFEGGSTDGKGYDLSIGSDSFIEGFEDGLIGTKVGETVSLDLKFPDNYDEALESVEDVRTSLLTALIEPIFDYDFLGGHVASYITMIAMAVMTLWSGIVYFKGYWKYINPSV